jgi:hypothetical protein
MLPEIFKNGHHQSYYVTKIVGCGGGPIVHLQIRDDLFLSNAKMGIKDMPARFDKMLCFGKDHDGILAGGRRCLVAKVHVLRQISPGWDEADQG